MTQKMTPDEALKLLDEVTSKAQGDRRLHSLIIQAIQTLKDLVEKQKQE